MLLLLAILSLTAASGSPDVDSAKSRLLRFLFADYNKVVEPSNSRLLFDLSILCAHGGQNGEPLSASVVEQYKWLDHRLVWSPDEYAGIKQLRVPDSFIWKPDMKLYNSLAAPEIRDSCNADLMYNGTIIWFPRAFYKTLCSHEHCQYQMGLWTYDSLSVPIQLWSYEPVGIHYNNLTCPLKLTSVSSDIKTTYYDCCEAPYAHLQYNVTFQRTDMN